MFLTFKFDNMLNHCNIKVNTKLVLLNSNCLLYVCRTEAKHIGEISL